MLQSPVVYSRISKLVVGVFFLLVFRCWFYILIFHYFLGGVTPVVCNEFLLHELALAQIQKLILQFCWVCGDFVVTRFGGSRILNVCALGFFFKEENARINSCTHTQGK